MWFIISLSELTRLTREHSRTHQANRSDGQSVLVKFYPSQQQSLLTATCALFLLQLLLIFRTYFTLLAAPSFPADHHRHRRQFVSVSLSVCLFFSVCFVVLFRPPSTLATDSCRVADWASKLHCSRLQWSTLFLFRCACCSVSTGRQASTNAHTFNEINQRRWPVITVISRLSLLIYWRLIVNGQF